MPDMKLHRYQILSIDPLKICTGKGKNKGTNFVFPATRRCSKVYVVRTGHQIVYVGSTTQPLRNRLYGALIANGVNGYYGYGWKKHKGPLELDLWVLSGIGCRKGQRCKIAETVEAEVVFLVRQQDNNWPKHQTEIHFHQSRNRERTWARRIYDFASTAKINGRIAC